MVGSAKFLEALDQSRWTLIAPEKAANVIIAGIGRDVEAMPERAGGGNRAARSQAIAVQLSAGDESGAEAVLAGPPMVKRMRLFGASLSAGVLSFRESSLGW